MPTMLSEVYEALLSVGIAEEKARKAAEALSHQESRFTDLERRFSKVDADMLLLKWMTGTSIALHVAVLTRLVLR